MTFTSVMEAIRSKGAVLLVPAALLVWASLAIGHREPADVERCTAALAGVEVPAAPPLALGRAVVLSRVLGG